MLALIDHIRPRDERPAVVLKYAQTVDGRIATASGDARWISGEEERTVSHALRAASDAVMVGVGTVLADDPQLTVRMVPGASPTRVVLDSALRVPDDARILDQDAPTVILTTERSCPSRRAELGREASPCTSWPSATAGSTSRPGCRACAASASNCSSSRAAPRSSPDCCGPGSSTVSSSPSLPC